MATVQRFAAQRTWTPAARAPVLHPPRPANRSIDVGMDSSRGYSAANFFREDDDVDLLSDS